MTWFKARRAKVGARKVHDDDEKRRGFVVGVICVLHNRDG